MQRFARYRTYAVLGALSFITLGIWAAVFAESARGVLTVAVLDVGQGDAIFIESPTGNKVLVDGGPGDMVMRRLAEYVPFFDHDIDAVIATHPDADHIGGLPDVLKRYRVDRVFYSSVGDDGSDQQAFMVALEEEVRGGAEKIIAERGQLIELGGGAHIEILFPDRAVPAIETNTGSVIVRVVYGETNFMLTGDSPQNIEKYLVRLDAEELKANVLKVGHHGSKTSSAELFLGFVNPNFAVFSRGCDNNYGHPAPEIVALFERFEIPTLDTCKDGRITFVSDGRTVSLRR